MAILIFRLNDVPEAEADAVRTLLLEGNIDFYETTSGNWGFSVAGIWIRNNDDKLKARKLIEGYQSTISTDDMEIESFVETLFQHPLRTVLYLGIVVFILYVSIVPFMSMAE